MDINYVEKFRNFIKTNRIRTYHEGVEIFYYQEVQDMLEAMASTPKEPEAVHGNEQTTVVCPTCKSIDVSTSDKINYRCNDCKAKWANW